MKKRILSLLALAALLCTCLPTALAQAEEPLPLTMYITMNQSAEIPVDGNAAEALIEAYTGVDLKVNFYTDTVLHELLPTLIAGEDLPMVCGFGGSQLSKTYMISAMKDDVFWDLTDYVTDYETYPNFAYIDEAVYDSYRVDGRIYGLPKQRAIARDGVVYRYDWLQNLGMDEPETVQDLVDMLVAFTKNDPDGNGADDTYGCIVPSTVVDRLALYMGAPNGWKYEDGQMINWVFSEEYQQALDIGRELYAMGAFPSEYAIQSRDEYEALFREGRAGSYWDVTSTLTGNCDVMAQEEAVLHMRGAFTNEDGNIFTGAGKGHNGILVFSKKAIPDEETLKRVLKFFNDLGDEAMCTLLTLGQEGVDYDVVDGVAVPKESEDSLMSLLSWYVQPMAVILPKEHTIPYQMTYAAERVQAVELENAPYAVANPTTGLNSDVYNDIGAECDTVLNDAKTLYIMGQISKEEYLAQLEQWKQMGGDAIAADYARLYEESRGL